MKEGSKRTLVCFTSIGGLIKKIYSNGDVEDVFIESEMTKSFKGIRGNSEKVEEGREAQ